jgi:DNA-binding transcriptional ArsR family regulator
MSSPLTRLQESISRTDEDRSPRFVPLDGAGDEVLDALGSPTGRRIYRRLLDAPASPSTVAEAVDTSVQNASHHVSNLEAAGLIEPVGTRYSEKGREMTVWAATDSCVVLGADEDATRESLLSHLAALGVLALLTVVVNAVFVAARTAIATGRTPLTPSSPGTETGLPPTAAGTILSVVEPGIVVFVAGTVLLAGLVLFGRYRTG